MRVVAGSARGLRLVAPPGEGTRPTTDRVREAVFNALGSMGAVEGATVLDAFAGSGALGIEALSRGAGRCVFVDPDRGAREALAANLATTGLTASAEVVAGTAAVALRRSRESFDLVLLDPPRASDDWPGLLDAVAPRVAEDGVVVIESDRPIVGSDGTVAGSALGTEGAPTSTEAGPPGAGGWAGGWTVIREKRYGGTVVQMATPHPPAGDPQ